MQWTPSSHFSIESPGYETIVPRLSPSCVHCIAFSALLKARVIKLNAPIIDVVCPHETVQYNCSFRTDSRDLSLVWKITYPEQVPVAISYNETSTVNDIQDFGNSIQSSLTRYVANVYIESIMSLEFLNNRGPIVQCIVSNLPPEELNLTVYQGRSFNILIQYTIFLGHPQKAQKLWEAP